MVKQLEEARMSYRTCLNASIDCTKFLLRQGLSFRGHDEGDTSNNRGNYLELLQFLADHDEKIKNARLFSLLVGEARDVSIKEKMAVVLRYMDKNGKVIERLVGVQPIPDTTANTLKESIDAFFNFNELSFSNLRGQDYDGASNMKCEFSGLKTKILNEQPCAFYVHCFAH
ncbi:uncharacterized protein [Pyrus communis]|uniref:uncharacterized protein n=1 Tax=Pyrus communis TaxID=23211 RepID=UPI0035BF69E3